jgi:Flp pilus assembly protein TadD
LEFGFGDSRSARRSLASALALSPFHAPAHAQLGFVFAARNQPQPAEQAFQRARELDPALADAWLGLGLLEFRRGNRTAGLDYLRTAAALQANRSLLHSYLGKGFGENHQSAGALGTLDRARSLDPDDPTPWFYSALELHGQNRVNEAIGDLEGSVYLNDNRAVYRSRLLLDQDRAVRATSLARVYQRAGLLEPALREAAKAVNDDYSNPSAHLFLADAFNAMRDPTRFGLRHETVWFNELLLANLLSPVDAGVLSPNLSHQEFTRLFARDGLRWSSFGEARSDRQFRQLATQSGVWGGTAYALDLDYQYNEGTRPNNDLERTEIYVQGKQQIGPQDAAMLLLKFQEYSSGDNFQYLDPAEANSSYRYDESQSPIAVGFWRHEWSPGIQTLALGGRLENLQRFTATETNWVVLINDAGSLSSPLDYRLDVELESEFKSFVGEMSQIVRTDHHTLVAGLRLNDGTLQTRSKFFDDTGFAQIFGARQGETEFAFREVNEDFSRTVLYLYETWSPGDALSLTAGLAWDVLEWPANFRRPPVADGLMEESRILPKAALVWRALPQVTIRGMYAQAMGGVSLDESYRLEPAQLAGFSQAYRTVIPESLVGSVSGHLLNVAGVAVDIHLPSRTYVGAEFSHLGSAVQRKAGVFGIDSAVEGHVLQLSERIEYAGNSVGATIHQLLGERYALGGVYRFGRSSLERSWQETGSLQSGDADLHSLRLQAVCNMASGFFMQSSCTLYWQSYLYAMAEGDEDHQTWDMEAGWRLARQRGEVSVGLLNLLNQDYRLHPLSAIPDLPRERVLFARLRLSF